MYIFYTIYLSTFFGQIECIGLSSYFSNFKLWTWTWSGYAYLSFSKQTQEILPFRWTVLRNALDVYWIHSLNLEVLGSIWAFLIITYFLEHSYWQSWCMGTGEWNLFQYSMSASISCNESFSYNNYYSVFSLLLLIIDANLATRAFHLITYLQFFYYCSWLHIATKEYKIARPWILLLEYFI